VLPYFISSLIGALIGGYIMAAVGPAFYNKIMPNAGQVGSSIVINVSENETVASAVAKKVMPTVVGISTITVENDIYGFGRKAQGVGSGVIVNPNGYILTNSHVVGNIREKLTVYFMDGREMEGQVLWQDAVLDMAVVKVDAVGLTTAELGNSDNISVGQTAIAIGNPLGLRFERTVTQGIISGLNRSVAITQQEIMEDLIQTDAAINPGNSGGPLINSKGEIVGLNTVKASAEGLGFAIPINIAKPIIQQLIDTGKFVPTYLGIELLDKEIAGYIKTDIEITKGIYITNVIKGAGADSAGLKAEDVITHVDDVEVNTMIKFKSMLYTKKPGDTVTIRYLRNNKEYKTQAVLQQKPEE
jgi:serine protease Do